MTAVVTRVRTAGGEPTSAVLHHKPSQSRFGVTPDHFAAVEDRWLSYSYKI